VDEDNQPVAIGEPSAKVLVTNLYNYVQPLIRYELNDTFVRQPDAPEHGHLRAIVRGRSDEVLTYGDIEVHPHVVRSVLVKTPEVVDYQVHQTPSGIDVEALASAEIDVTGLTARLAAALESAGLADAQVNLRIVNSLERHAQTGKLRRFIPLPSTVAPRP
jgi:phenylacetate-coenzyme A ligase PaaK-like adenylate-forming protein